MASRTIRSEEAQRRAQEHFTESRRRAAEAVRDQEKARNVEAEKVRKLRALRLAKEASDRAAVLAQPPKPIVRKKPARATTPAI
jgi:hypothetical protein